MGTYEPLIRVGFLPISGIFLGIFFADFGIHLGVISKISGSIFVSGPYRVIFQLRYHLGLIFNFEYDSRRS